MVGADWSSDVEDLHNGLMLLGKSHVCVDDIHPPWVWVIRASRGALEKTGSYADSLLMMGVYRGLSSKSLDTFLPHCQTHAVAILPPTLTLSPTENGE